MKDLDTLLVRVLLGMLHTSLYKMEIWKIPAFDSV